MRKLFRGIHQRRHNVAGKTAQAVDIGVGSQQQHIFDADLAQGSQALDHFVRFADDGGIVGGGVGVGIRAGLGTPARRALRR